MLRYILRRVLLMIPVLLGVSLVTFIIIRSIPGDPVQVMLGADRRTTPEQIEAIRASYGLDQSLPVQYLKWLGHVLTGDLGDSLRTKRPLTQELRLRLPVTVELTLMAGIIAAIPAMIFGVLAALRRNSGIDYAATLMTLIGVSVPNFFLATILVLVFSFWLKWLPPVGFKPFTDDPVQNLKTMIMPAVALGLPLAAILMRFVRSSVLEVLGQDYVRTARAKGLRDRLVVMRHVLRNALVPVITVVGIQTGYLLGGTVIVEQIFSIPGIGRLALDAVLQRDYPVVQGTTLFIAAGFVFMNLVTDVVYGLVDPRIRVR